MFATDIYGSFGEKQISDVLFSGSNEKGVGLWAAEILLLFTISVKVSHISQEYLFLHYMEVKGSIDTVDETLRSVRLT